MRDQNKTAFARQIIAHELSPFHVQMVGRFVDEQEAVFLQEQGREHYLCLLAIRQGRKRPVQHILGHLQQIQLAHEFPVDIVRKYFADDIHGQIFRIFNLERKILKSNIGGDMAAVFVFALKQVQKRRFPPAVPPRKPQFPSGIDLKANVFKNVIVTALIGKSQIRHFN